MAYECSQRSIASLVCSAHADCTSGAGDVVGLRGTLTGFVPGLGDVETLGVHAAANSSTPPAKVAWRVKRVARNMVPSGVLRRIELSTPTVARHAPRARF